MSASKTVNHGPGSSQENSGTGSSQGSGSPGPSQGISSPGSSQESGGPGPSQESGGPGPSQEISGPPSSQEISVPGPSRRTRFVAIHTPPPPNYFLMDVLTSAQWAGQDLSKTNAFNGIFDEEDSSSEDENMRDHEFMRDVESCQKLRVKVLLELYKNLEGAPLSVGRASKDEHADDDELSPSR